MELSNEIVESYGFKKVNLSMWRLGHITLQNAWLTKGKNVLEKFLNAKKGYKVCFKSAYVEIVTTPTELESIIDRYHRALSGTNIFITRQDKELIESLHAKIILMEGDSRLLSSTRDLLYKIERAFKKISPGEAE